MSILKSLTFTAVPKPENSPLLHRRSKLADRLEDQKSLFSDPAYARVVRRWKKHDGERVQVEHEIRVRPWWHLDEKGQIVFTVKLGSNPAEFEKGKAGILVGPREKLPEVIDALIAAARSGELDAVLEQSKGVRPVPKKKAA